MRPGPVSRWVGAHGAPRRSIMRTAGCAGTARPGVTSARGHPRGAREPPVPGPCRLRDVPPASRAVPPFRPQVCHLPVPRRCHLSPGNVTSLSPDVPAALEQYRHSVPTCVTSSVPLCHRSACGAASLTTCPLAMSLLCPQMYHLPVSSATFLSPDAAPALEQHHISVPSCAARPHAVSPCPQMCHLPDTSQCHPDHRQRYHLSLTPCMGVQLWPCCHLCPPRMGSASPVEPPAPCAMPLSPMSQT